MFDQIKEFLQRFFKSRTLVLLVVMIFLVVVLLQRLFVMQIVNGEDYQSTYAQSIEKTITVDGVRGNIYDRNGKLLAYSKLAYKVTLTDSGTYDTTDEKNKALNKEINTIIDILEKNGDEINNTFHITFHKSSGAVSFDVSGTSLKRFRADIFGHADIKDLTDNKELGANEATASASQIYKYLLNSYGLDSADTAGGNYSDYRTYQICVLRYALAANRYQKYVSTTIAQDVSEATVAAIKENADNLEGVAIENGYKRVYKNAECYSNIIGYVGQISTDEYNTYSKKDDSYSLSDYVGKTGIERVMESQLHAKKGEQKVYVNNVGKIQKVISKTEAGTGNDVYLSIDSKLQKAVYKMLRQEIASILASSIRNTKSQSSSGNVFTPVYDVYAACLTNNVIDLDKMSTAKSGTVQHDVYQTFDSRRSVVLKSVRTALNSNKAYNKQSDEMQDYLTYIVKDLQSDGIFDSNMVDSSDSTYKAWKKGKVSVKQYLTHAIEQNWIDVSALNIKSKYSNMDEIYAKLVNYIEDSIQDDNGFSKQIYRELVYSDDITGRQVGLILYEQKILKKDSAYNSLKSGSSSAYSFMVSKIRSLDLEPGMLGLDPCSGSCVIMDPQDGTVLACVSYPGYDSNKLANAEDSTYYNNLLTNTSVPLYDYATQQTTAPGSTFKPCVAAAGLTEGVINTGSVIVDTGIYKKQGMNLKCWVYPSNHGSETVTDAIRDSCNYYFCEVGNRLSTVNGKYSESTGVKNLKTYANAFGLGKKTDIELSENSGHSATELPIAAGIGQSNNAFTTVQLARYASALANNGTVYNLTVLDKVTNSSGKTIKSYKPKVRNKVSTVSDSSWSAIRKGMVEAVKTHSQFNSVSNIKLAGKTGTAQESKSRPNHALFIGYAPYDDPEIAIAVRIAHGYSSSNACSVSAKILKYYFTKDKKTQKELENSSAAEGASTNSND